MAKKCVVELELAPSVIDLDAAQFRAFVIDNCYPVMWERFNEAKAKYNLINPLITNEMRSGSADISCSTDFKGDTKCSGSVRWTWWHETSEPRSCLARSPPFVAQICSNATVRRASP